MSDIRTNPTVSLVVQGGRYLVRVPMLDEDLVALGAEVTNRSLRRP